MNWRTFRHALWDVHGVFFWISLFPGIVVATGSRTGAFSFVVLYCPLFIVFFGVALATMKSALARSEHLANQFTAATDRERGKMIADRINPLSNMNLGN